MCLAPWSPMWSLINGAMNADEVPVFPRAGQFFQLVASHVGVWMEIKAVHDMKIVAATLNNFLSIVAYLCRSGLFANVVVRPFLE